MIIRADGQEENKGKRTSQKHPNSFPSIGKGRVAVFDGPAILAMYSPSSKSHTILRSAADRYSLVGEPTYRRLLARSSATSKYLILLLEVRRILQESLRQRWLATSA